MEAKKFCENVEKYQNDMYVMAYAILRNETDAEDAVSNAILKAYENIGKLRSLRKMRAWLLAITKNEALLIKRKRLFLPEGTVKSRLSRGKEELRKALERGDE